MTVEKHNAVHTHTDINLNARARARAHTHTHTHTHTHKQTNTKRKKIISKCSQSLSQIFIMCGKVKWKEGGGWWWWWWWWSAINATNCSDNERFMSAASRRGGHERHDHIAVPTSCRIIRVKTGDVKLCFHTIS